MTNITTGYTVKSLREIFAEHGLPDTIVTDHGSSFTSSEFQTFTQLNGIKHVRSAPFKPASNGQTELAVQIVKNGLKSLTKGSLQTRLSRFLLSYRTRPQTVTGRTPTELLMNRELKITLSLVHPN